MGEQCFLTHDPLGNLIEQFSYRYPKVPVRVQFEYWQTDQDVVCEVFDAFEAGQAIVAILINPHRPYIEVVRGLCESLTLASYWGRETGIPETDDIPKNDMGQRLRHMAEEVGAAQWLVSLPTENLLH